MSHMKHFYRNLSIAKYQADPLRAASNACLQMLPKGYAAKLSPLSLYAATLGFENWEDIQKFSTQQLEHAPHSLTHWGQEFSVRLERKWQEYLADLRITEVAQLVSDLATARQRESCPLDLDDTDFDGIVYSNDNLLFLPQPYANKLEECLRTKTPIHLQQLTGSSHLTCQAQDDLLETSGKRATAKGVAPNNPALAYQGQVLQFARQCIQCIGLKPARASKLWTVEFAYDAYDAACKRSLLICNRAKPNPILFLDFFAKELGHSDFEAYQASQCDPLTCNYDSRADHELTDAALRMRKKMREGYLYRYLSKLGLPIDVVTEAYAEILPALEQNMYGIALNAQPPESHWESVKSRFQVPINPRTHRLLDRINEFCAGGNDLTDEEEVALREFCFKFPDGYRDAFLYSLKPLCKKWQTGTKCQADRARRYLEHFSKTEGGEWTLLLVQHLLSNAPSTAAYERANSLLGKIHKEAESGSKPFTDVNLALEFARLASERLSSSKKQQRRAEALKAALQILEKPSLLSVEEIKQKYFTGPDGVVDQAAFIELSNDLDIAKKTALQLGFLDKESILRSLHLQRGAE